MVYNGKKDSFQTNIFKSKKYLLKHDKLLTKMRKNLNIANIHGYIPTTQINYLLTLISYTI